MIVVANIGLVFAAACALIRVLLGPTLADRVIALDVVLVCLMTGIALNAARTDDAIWLNLLVVIAIIGFVATVSVTRFIERDARREGS